MIPGLYEPCAPCRSGAHGACTRGMVGEPLCSCSCAGLLWEGLPPPQHPPAWQPPPAPEEPCMACCRQHGSIRVARARWCDRGEESCQHLADKAARSTPPRRTTDEERRHGPGRTNPRKRRQS